VYQPGFSRPLARVHRKAAKLPERPSKIVRIEILSVCNFYAKCLIFGVF
jgi:hypothetical protein